MIDFKNTKKLRVLRLQQQRRQQVEVLANALACKLVIAPHEKRLIWCLDYGSEQKNGHPIPDSGSRAAVRWPLNSTRRRFAQWAVGILDTYGRLSSIVTLAIWIAS